ncbi:hypothetical protein E8E14_011931 [Neopestalotiopsis sp. 37M]|nr:hypothetical protein E8E14_011931 [Neopestalotiopsis sp. 37M]
MDFSKTVFLRFQDRLVNEIEKRRDGPVLPSLNDLKHALATFPQSLPDQGSGLDAVATHLITDILPGLSLSSLSPRYYGFITGGCTPAALLADNLVSALDQNVQVHLPEETLATDVELKAMAMLRNLVNLDDTWSGSFTSGSSVSNLMGLACGREWILAKFGASIGNDGLLRSLEIAGISDIQILVTRHHPSIVKSASVLGLGRRSIKQVGLPNEPWRIDFALLEREMQRQGTASIISVSCGEVMTGQFATDESGMTRLRALCDTYGAWLHVDAAFGLFARSLPSSAEYSYLRSVSAGVELADSITGDGHKLLNVPYDCGFFLHRHPATVRAVFETPPLATFSTRLDPSVPSPLNVGVQNSRRLRALPVYATLVAYGRRGHEDMLARHIGVARAVAAFVIDSPDFELLPEQPGLGKSEVLERVYMLILFRARDEGLNQKLLELINRSGHAYLAGATWNDRPAVRMAVSNWRVDIERERLILTKMLSDIVFEWKHQNRKSTSSRALTSKM